MEHEPVLTASDMTLDEARALQRLHVLGDTVEAHGERLGQVADPELSGFTKKLHDFPSVRVREGVEHEVQFFLGRRSPSVFNHRVE